jgi:hypothetical protein
MVARVFDIPVVQKSVSLLLEWRSFVTDGYAVSWLTRRLMVVLGQTM